MPKINRRSMLLSSTVAAAAMFGGLRSTFAQSASLGPEDLKSTLTPFGAERAGNADGSIPAWTGGYATIPADYKSGDPRPIPFADEKPLFSITSANISQYLDKLSAGQLELFSRNADFRMDVYPTHRTAIAPQYVYDNICKNASTAQLAPDGNSISGAYGGIPFPIPTNGHQVAWNHALSWKGVTLNQPGENYVRTANGQLELETVAAVIFQYGYYLEGKESSFDGYYSKVIIRLDAPPYEAGTAILQLNPVNPTLTPTRNFEYLLGERRTRAAPELDYDTPNSTTGGVVNWDEYEVLYGPFEEYDFKLLGKKEMYVPYNANRAWATPIATQLGPKFFSPDIARFELHRTWMVELTVKPGKRNVDAKRVMYFDEDTWQALLSDIYDASGALWKFEHSLPVILADIPAVITSPTLLYDFHANNYCGFAMVDSAVNPQCQKIDPLPDSYFTPAQLAALSGGE